MECIEPIFLGRSDKRVKVGDNMERIPKQGEFYRHFKNKLYQITAVAEHSETGEEFVVYQALYGEYKTYIRPLLMFAGEVDHEKYPEVKQKYRFEQVTLSPGGRECGQEETENSSEYLAENSEEEGQAPNPYLMAFIEAEGMKARLEALFQMKGKVGQEELNSICLILDIPERSGDLEQQLFAIQKHLETVSRFDGSRLRG